jgi:hypothetical protein
MSTVVPTLEDLRKAHTMLFAQEVSMMQQWLEGAADSCSLCVRNSVPHPKGKTNIENV